MREKRLSAGRDLDALVAEHVMGFRREGQPKDYDGNYGGEPVLMHPGESWASLASYGYNPPPKGCIALTFFVPAYSTRFDDAMKVVQRLQGFVSGREHPWWSVALFYGQPGQIGCRVYACAPGHSIFDTERVVIAEEVADTAPLAVCYTALAALRAAPCPAATPDRGAEG